MRRVQRVTVLCGCAFSVTAYLVVWLGIVLYVVPLGRRNSAGCRGRRRPCACSSEESQAAIAAYGPGFAQHSQSVLLLAFGAIL